MNLKEIKKNWKLKKYLVGKNRKSSPSSPGATWKWKLKNSDDTLPFISAYNTSNSNVFPKVPAIYGNLQTSKNLGKNSLNTN